MTLGRFLAGKVNNGATVKVLWPEKNKIAVGKPVEFFQETSMLAANVFDFMITDSESVGYEVIIWLTRSKETMFDI